MRFRAFIDVVLPREVLYCLLHTVNAKSLCITFSSINVSSKRIIRSSKASSLGSAGWKFPTMSASVNWSSVHRTLPHASNLHVAPCTRRISLRKRGQQSSHTLYLGSSCHRAGPDMTPREFLQTHNPEVSSYEWT